MSIIINPLTQQANIALNATGVGTGSLPNTISESLIELKYSFPDFVQSDMNDFTYGDVVVLADGDSNSYGCVLAKANTLISSHASKMLMVFVSYSGSTLVLMHKGYIDFDNVSETGPITSWSNGQTLYVSGTQVGINPPSISGHWVKSIGFCMPNINNKKRIWFESDSTYLTLQ
jgi:hypothetical protein